MTERRRLRFPVRLVILGIGLVAVLVVIARFF